MTEKEKSRAFPNVQLRRERERRNISQEQLAREIGTTALNVSRWERGITFPGLHFRQKLIEFFDKSAEELGLIQKEGERVHKHSSSPSSELRVAIPISDGLVYDPTIPSPPLTYRLLERQQLLDNLKLQLQSRKNLALNGLPGVGKTTLVIEFVNTREVLDYFHEGILWAGLGPEPNIFRLLRRWSSLLGIAPAEFEKLNTIEAWTKAIRTTIGTRRFLLVIDDAWSIENALAFRVGGPNCVHLVTTRFPEIALQFADDDTTVIHELNEDEGVKFIAQLVPEAFMREPDEVRALVQSVGGLPLALSLTGNYLRTQIHSGQPRRLRAAFHRLRNADERLRLVQPRGPEEIFPGLPSKAPLSLEAVISLSDQYLSEEARYALRALSVFPHKPNTFSEEAALVICARPPEALDALTDSGLLEVDGLGRYTLHPVIADYAKLHREDLVVEEPMVQYYINYIEAHASDYDALELEIHNVLASFEIATKREMKGDLSQVVNIFFNFLQARGSYLLTEAQLKQAKHNMRFLSSIDLG